MPLGTPSRFCPLLGDTTTGSRSPLKRAVLGVHRSSGDEREVNRGAAVWRERERLPGEGDELNTRWGGDGGRGARRGI